MQIENLRTHPSVAAKLATGALHVHAWVYQIETGEVFTYDAEEGQYVPLSEEAVSSDCANGKAFQFTLYLREEDTCRRRTVRSQLICAAISPKT